MITSSTSDRRIGIFGGSFNPPHLAHLIVAELVREQFDLERVLWLPNHQSPLKKPEDMASPAHRVAMTRLALAGNDGFSLSEVEIRRAGVSYTVETLRTLQDADPNVDFRLIIGSDSLAEFDSWREPREILRRVRLIVFPRPGSERARPASALEGRIDWARAPLLEISGTVIRNRIREGKSIRYLVPDAVRAYILEYGLYGSSTSTPTLAS